MIDATKINEKLKVVQRERSLLEDFVDVPFEEFAADGNIHEYYGALHHLQVALQAVLDIWHKVNYKGQLGYILSSFVELPGQDRETVIQKIKSKANELELDENVALALAGCESKYKPYATSKPYDPDDDKIAKGVFQITDQLAKDLNNEEKVFYSPISDLFDVDQSIAAG